MAVCYWISYVVAMWPGVLYLDFQKEQRYSRYFKCVRTFLYVFGVPTSLPTQLVWFFSWCKVVKFACVRVPFSTLPSSYTGDFIHIRIRDRSFTFLFRVLHGFIQLD